MNEAFMQHFCVLQYTQSTLKSSRLSDEMLNQGPDSLWSLKSQDTSHKE